MNSCNPKYPSIEINIGKVKLCICGNDPQKSSELMTKQTNKAEDVVVFKQKETIVMINEMIANNLFNEITDENQNKNRVKQFNPL